jgi:hypothetical protein
LKVANAFKSRLRSHHSRQMRAINDLTGFALKFIKVMYSAAKKHIIYVDGGSFPASSGPRHVGSQNSGRVSLGLIYIAKAS